MELKKDFNLPVLEQDKIDLLGSIINNKYEIQICLPIDNIKKFLKQFDIEY